MVCISLVASISYIIARTTKFPIFPSAPFLKMDFGEVGLILLTGFTSWKYGLLALIMRLFLSLTISGSNILGLVADLLICGTFLIVFDFLHKKESKLWLNVLVAGIIRMLISIPVNFIILPLQFGSNKYTIMSQLVWILPFNLLKSSLDGICFKVLYPRLEIPLKNSFQSYKEEI